MLFKQKSYLLHFGSEILNLHFLLRMDACENEDLPFKKSLQ